MNVPRVVAEAALVAVHVSVVVGFDRLYRGTSYLGPLLVIVLGSHALAIASRARRVPAPLVAGAAVAATALLATWTLFPGSTNHGVPTSATWHQASRSLREAHQLFAHVVAPVAPRDGYQLAAALALAAAVWFADWAAFRLRTTAEAVAPATVLFVFGALLGSGAHRLPDTIAFATTVLVFVAAHRAVRAGVDRAWIASGPVAGPRAVLRAGAAVAAVAVALGAVVGPRLPGAQARAVVSWRQPSPGDGSRVTVSPLVDLRKRLVDQSDVELFTVEANRPAYWRLTSLDSFDGRLWSSSGTYSPAGQTLPAHTDPIEESRAITQTIQVEALAAIWVPVAYQAQGVSRSTQALRWDPASSTLIVDSDQPSSDGLTFSAISQIPNLTARDLAADHGRDPASIRQRYTSLPGGFPQQAVDEARRATAGATDRYEQARMLQDWFRTRFTYSLAVPAGNGDDALVSFLRSRRGYCEQFAGAYAAMARSLGIPARVAVGFTQGDPDPNDPNEYHVLGRHAHAWPEVWFPGDGWVAFEPTPGRGMPDAQNHTGVKPAEDTTGTVAPPTSTTVPSRATPTTAAPRASATTVPPRRFTGTSGTPGGHGSGPSGGWVAAATLAGLVALWLLAVALVPVVRRRRRPGFGPLDAWAAVLEPVRWATGAVPAASETHREFAARAEVEHLAELADLVVATAWSPEGASAEQAQRAAELAATIRADLSARVGPARRLGHRLSWRGAFG